MGVAARLAAWTAGAVLFTAATSAAPTLRLENTVVGPVSVAAGASPAPQIVEAYNAGDGALSLQATASVPWLAPGVGAARACTRRPGLCIPISVAFNTGALARGLHSATVVIRDPNAVDAPQNLLVTVHVGGGVPDALELFAAPNGSADEVLLNSNSMLTARPATVSGGNWLSVLLDGTGSFRFVLPYKVTARHLGGMAEGSYFGSITTSGSAFAGDNKVVNVTFRVTSQPILRPIPDAVRVRIPQNGLRQTVNVSAVNRGLGNLTLTGATVAAGSGGNFLTAEKIADVNAIALTLDPGSLAQGVYQARVTFTSNAANAALAVPVEMEIVASGPPQSYSGGVVNNATFEGGELAKGLIAAVFGEQFTTRAPASAESLPLQTTLDGVRVLVAGRPAPVYFVSYGQINFQIPYDAPAGDSTVRVERDGEVGNPVLVRIVDVAPRILRLGIGEYGIIVNQDMSFPIPTTPGIPSRPARTGDVLVMYVLGGGPTNPAVASGVGAPGGPLANVPLPFQVEFGGGALLQQPAIVTPIFFGLTPAFVGLYQVNVEVTAQVPRGNNVPVTLSSGNIRSNTVQIAVAP
jgi:uncharacterized protein (TIGR03437 family)